MSIAQTEWFKSLKRERLANIYARKYPRKPPLSKRKDPEEVKRNREAGARKKWANPEYRAKVLNGHPWRQNYPTRVV